MKIKIIMTIAIVLSYAAISFATAIPTDGTSIGSGTTATPFKPSSRVSMDAISDGTNFAVAGQHASAVGNSTKGGFQYGTLDTTPSLLRAPASAAGTLVTAPTSATALPAAYVTF